MNKRRFSIFAWALLALAVTLAAADLGPRKLTLPGTSGSRAGLAAMPADHQIGLMAEMVAQGSLLPARSLVDPLSGMTDRRYTQVYRGLPVFGGEVVFHDRDGVTQSLSGKFYEIGALPASPTLEPAAAANAFQQTLDPARAAELRGAPSLIVYPVSDDDLRLAYLVTFSAGREYSMTGVVDATSGAVLTQFSNVWSDSGAIGLGRGYHGEDVKLATTLSGSTYYLADEKRIRPINQYTYDLKNGGYIPTTTTNSFTQVPEAVNAHQFLGFVYDYYYTVLGRPGIDGKNLDVIALVNDASAGNKDNAYWTGDDKMMVFGTPGSGGQQLAAAIDVVAHELSHGVTQFSSNLNYSYESGALNEAYSDVIGSAVEFAFQPEGTGLLKADWYNGEDGHVEYSTAGCRNLADPNTNSQLRNAGYPENYWYADPCHLSQQIPPLYYRGNLVDAGGVHLNSPIFGHAYYLLAHGGTNKISGRTVTGIGIEKATKIYYRAWTAYMTQTSKFINAANALLAAANSLYGQSGNEYNQTYGSMLAIGFVAE
jgi:bacillolysin